MHIRIVSLVHFTTLKTPALFLLLVPGFCLGQRQTFDLVTYTPPEGYRKQQQVQFVQFSQENKQKNTWCLITLYKSVDTEGDAKNNFDVSWNSMVRDIFKVAQPPTLQEPTKDGRWDILSGYAPFETNGDKGVAMLVTATGYRKLANLLVLTNSTAYEKDITDFLSGLRLKTDPGAVETATPPGGVILNTTTWDDGWVSVARNEWAEISKPGIRVLVHYPHTGADAYHASKETADQTAWNILVAPRYRDVRQFMNRGIQGSPSVTFLTADAVDRQTGKTVHVVFYKQHYDQGNGRYLEVVADSRQTFEREFGSNYIQTSSWEYLEQTKSWNKLAEMQWRNKFSVSGPQLVGTWTSSDYASLSYYFVSSGRYAGSTATSISNEFNFRADNTYSSQHSGASGQVGDLKFATQKYTGRYRANTWTVTLTDRFRGGPETFSCYFEAVRGGVILSLTDANNTTNHYAKRP